MRRRPRSVSTRARASSVARGIARSVVPAARSDRPLRASLRHADPSAGMHSPAARHRSPAANLAMRNASAGEGCPSVGARSVRVIADLAYHDQVTFRSRSDSKIVSLKIRSRTDHDRSIMLQDRRSWSPRSAGPPRARAYLAHVRDARVRVSCTCVPCVWRDVTAQSGPSDQVTKRSRSTRCRSVTARSRSGLVEVTEDRRSWTLAADLGLGDHGRSTRAGLARAYLEHVHNACVHA